MEIDINDIKLILGVVLSVITIVGIIVGYAVTNAVKELKLKHKDQSTDDKVTQIEKDQRMHTAEIKTNEAACKRNREDILGIDKELTHLERRFNEFSKVQRDEINAINRTMAEMSKSIVQLDATMKSLNELIKQKL